MTLKKFEIYDLPRNAEKAVVPGKIITAENAKSKEAGIDFERNIEKSM